jgi:hypothetical protein
MTCPKKHLRKAGNDFWAGKSQRVCRAGFNPRLCAMVDGNVLVCGEEIVY